MTPTIITLNDTDTALWHEGGPESDDLVCRLRAEARERGGITIVLDDDGITLRDWEF